MDVNSFEFLGFIYIYIYFKKIDLPLTFLVVSFQRFFLSKCLHDLIFVRAAPPTFCWLRQRFHEWQKLRLRANQGGE